MNRPSGLMIGLIVVVVLGLTALTTASAMGLRTEGGYETAVTETPTGNVSDVAMGDETMTNESMANGNMSNDTMSNDTMRDASTKDSMDDDMSETKSGDGMTETAMADDMTDIETDDAAADTAMADGDRTETSNPGFGIAVAVIAVLAIAGLVYRRRT